MKFLKMCVLLLCVCLVPSLAGCSLITNNVGKQLNEVVASFDNGRIEVTREQLIMTYNNIGNNRFDNQQAPTEKGVEQTLYLALDRAILVDFLTADNNSKRDEMGIQKVVLTTYEANEIWRNVYNYVNSAIKNFEQELRQEADAVLNEDTAEDDSESKKYVPFEKTYSYYYDNVNDKYVLERNEIEPKVENVSIALFDTKADIKFSEKAKTAMKTFREKYWEYTDSTAMDPSYESENSFSDKAWNKYINAITRAEADRNLSKEPAEVFLRKIEEVYEVFFENQVLMRFQDDFDKANNADINMVAEKYKQNYNAQLEQFNANESAFDKLVATSAEKVYYMKNTKDYFKVNHILVKFSDSQTKDIEKEKKKFENGQISKTQYDANVEKIKSNTKAYNRDTKEYESLDVFYSKLNTALDAVTGEQARMAVFRDFMHRYSQDDATLNANACYYIPTDKSKDTMQEDFANVSREIYDNGNGKVSTISNWAETSFGYHIIMYTGQPKNVSIDSSNEVILDNLNGYFLNPLYNKTMLDQVIENVILSSYSAHEYNILDQIKAGKDIVKNPKAYADLYAKKRA